MLCLGRKIGEKILDDSFTAPLSFPSPYHLPAVCTNLPLRPSLFFHSDRTHLSSQPSAKERHRQRWKQISLVLCENHSLAITEPQRFFTTGPNLKVRKRLAHVFYFWRPLQFHAIHCRERAMRRFNCGPLINFITLRFSRISRTTTMYGHHSYGCLLSRRSSRVECSPNQKTFLRQSSCLIGSSSNSPWHLVGSQWCGGLIENILSSVHWGFKLILVCQKEVKS